MTSLMCTMCKESKPIGEFYIHKSGRQAGRPLSYCKPCRASYEKNYRENNREEIRSRIRRQRYGLSEEQINNLSNECEICSCTNDLHVDHDHMSNEFRGTLCGTCNRGLGMFKDDPNLMINAINYLLKFQNRLV